METRQHMCRGPRCPICQQAKEEPTANSRCSASTGYLKFFEDGWRRAYQKREKFDSFSDAFDFSKCWERCQRCKFLQDNYETNEWDEEKLNNAAENMKIPEAFESEYSNKQIEKMRQLLGERDVDQSEDSTLFDVFMEGCTGWSNFSDEFVVEQFFEYFEESDLK